MEDEGGRDKKKMEQDGHLIILLTRRCSSFPPTLVGLLIDA